MLPFDRERNATDPLSIRAGQLTAIAGPVYLLYDNRGVPFWRDLGRPFVVVSVAGINFDYCGADVLRYVMRSGPLDRVKFPPGTAENWDLETAN